MPNDILQTHSKRSSKLSEIVVFILLFFFIYSPFIPFGAGELKLPFILVFSYGVIGAPLLLYAYSTNSLFRRTFTQKLFGVAIVLLLVSFHDSADPSIFSQVVPGLFAVSGAFVFVTLYRKLYPSNYSEKLIFHIFWVGVFHGLVIVGIIANAELKNFLEARLYYSEKALASLIDLNRSPGILFEGFGVLSITQSLTLNCGLAVSAFQRGKRSFGSEVLTIAGAALIVLSIFATVRVGLVVMLVNICVLIVALKLSKRSDVATVRLPNVLIGVILVTGSAIVFSVARVEEADEYSNVIYQGLEWAINYFYEGELRTASTDYLFEHMYYGTETAAAAVFGTGDFLRNDTDVGYVALLFGVGIVGIISVFWYILSLMYISGKLRIDNELGAYVVFSLCVSILVANTKDFYVDNVQGFSQIFSLCYVLLMTSLPCRQSRAPLR